ncbi:MAG: amino acid adenylation domain-containing protein [Ruminococcaceae bacterium]|nr:amino acid adenylation domain-containing protein [Oscillospiraceae bacterium]
MYQTNILEYLENTADRYPKKIAFSNGEDNVSFSELSEIARSIGSFLAQRGYFKEPVAVFMDKHPTTVAAFFGVIYSGCFYVSLDSEMPPERIRKIISKCRVRAVICSSQNLVAARGICGECEIFEYDDIYRYRQDNALLDNIRDKHTDKDAVYAVFTSGSTGEPKGVVVCHRSVIDYTEALCEAIGFNHNSVFANQAPLYFDAPIKEIMPTVKLGGTVHLLSRKMFMSPVQLCRYLNEHKVNTICWTASALMLISSLGALENHAPKHLKIICFGSEVFLRKDYDRWRRACPEAVFFNLYGPTEATGMSCFWKADRELGKDEAIPIGRPFRNTQIILFDSNNPKASECRGGEMYIRGSCVSLGYVRDGDKNAEAFVQDPTNTLYPDTVYKTGDIARYNSCGELVFVGRTDHQIKHMGYRIELGEIETVASGFSGIARACCVYDGEKITMYYTGNCASEDVRQHMKEVLPKYMLPKDLVRIECFPMTCNGKLDRQQLLDMTRQMKNNGTKEK